MLRKLGRGGGPSPHLVVPATERGCNLVSDAYIGDAGHVRLLLRKRPETALLAERWRKSICQQKRAYGIIRRKPLKEKVPETGLEPALG